MEELKSKVAGMDEKQKKSVLGGAVLVLALVLLIFYMWSPGCASAKSCAELRELSGDTNSWPVHTGFHGAGGGSGSGQGDVKVCGESDSGLGPDHSKRCFGGLNSNAHDVAGPGTQRSAGPGGARGLSSLSLTYEFE